MPRWTITKKKYGNNWAKYAVKRKKMTCNQFHEEENVCPECKGKSFLAEKPSPHKFHGKYRTYGYLTHRVAWRVRCNSKNCGEQFAVILKPECWDSAGA